MENFIINFLRIVEEHGNEPAVSDEFGTFSYAEFLDYSLIVAGNLKSNGVQFGSRVIIEIHRCKEYAGCLMGCWLMGAVAIPLSDDYPEDRLDYIKKDSQYEIIIDEDFIKNMDMSVKANPLVADMETEGLVIYTSGSTGNPKGVIHDFYSMSEVANRNAVHDQSEETERNNVVGLVAPFTFIVGVGLFLSAMSISKHLVIVSDEIRRDPFKLAKYYDDNNIESSFVPPRMVNFMLENNKSLKVISVGSERITNLYFDDKPVVINGYGSTELFGGTLAFKIDKKYENTPIGVPFGNEKVYVLDDKNNEVQRGELCVSGYIAKGYLNRPEETKKAFIKNPFKNIDGYDRMFRTGDIVERLPDGNLVFIERKDWMIKINGQRVEPLEVEKTIRRLPGIKEVAVKDFSDDNGLTYLATYYACDEKLTSEEIKEFCKNNLTSYMVPAFYIKMDSLPLNPNGKLDRINLPKPDVSLFKSEYIPPENKIEEAICNAMEAVLKCGKLGRCDDFFLLGGDSIKAIKTINLLADLPLDTESFMAGRTPKDIAALIEKGGTGGISFEKVKKDVYPLTASQLGVYFALEANPNTLMYNNPVSIEIEKGVDVEKLIAAIEKSVNNHGAYHCNISICDGQPCMVPCDRVFAVKKCTTKNMEDALTGFVEPFDLENGELVRACIFDDGARKVLAFDAHHIVFDGTTLSILLGEISKCYEGKDIYEERNSAFDISTYEEILKTTQEYKEAGEYFDQLFDGREVSNDFPCDYEDRNIAKQGSLDRSITLDQGKLLKFLKENNFTENSLFLAAFAFVLAKYNGTDTSLVSVGESGRHTSMSFNTAGMMVKTLALPTDLKEESDITDYIRKLQNTFRLSIKNDIYPFGEVAGKYGFTNDFSFVYQGDNFSTLHLGDIALPVRGIDNPDAMNKLTLMVFSDGNNYRFSFRYRADLYSLEIMEAFADAYACAVSDFIEKETVEEVNLISKEQEERLDSFCAKTFELQDKTITEFFDEWAEKLPNKELVVYKEKRYTYKETADIANSIAQYIIKLGLKNNDVVSILIPRSEWMILATYGVLKAGCAYEPLDPSYPSERLGFMVSNANAKLLIATKDLVGMIKNYSGEILYIEDIASLPKAPKINVKNDPDDLCVLLYTSGTTGNPKGVMLTHKNATAIVQYNKRNLELTSDVVNAGYASFGFDAGFNDLVTIPSVGGTIHIIPEDIRLDLKALDEYYTENKVSYAVFTTQVGRQFALMTKSPYLKKLAVGGETLVPLDTSQLGFDMYNLYGPTECSVYVSSIKVEDFDLRIPIGTLNENIKGYVVDSNFKRLPVGAPGELVIAGPQVGKGYLNLPEKTDEVFVENPFAKEKENNWAYRTGDIVRFLPNGMLDYIGRRDGQVKIRGFRVELAEIEEVIRRFAGITDATVAAFDDLSGKKYIAAYVVSQKEVDIAALNSFIASEKPAYMVPAVTMQIDKIPLNQNHKVNKRALPKPKRKVENIKLPQNSVQQTIYDICSRELGHSEFGIDMDLFDAGLTSIGIIRLNVELDKALNISFKVSDIREHSTVESLAEFACSLETQEEYEIFEDYPLSKTQMGIYIECSSNADTVTYNIPLMLKLGKGLDVDRLCNAIKMALNAHPYTKTTLFANNQGEIRAARNDEKEPVVSRIKCDAIPTSDELIRPFKLLGEPLYRVSIYEANDGNYLFMDFHHIILDGMSENILLADIGKAYEGKELTKERYTGYEVALDEESACNSKEHELAKEHFDLIFKGCDPDCMPPKAPEKTKTGAGFATRNASTSSVAVTNYCKTNNFTANAYFNAAFAYTLSCFGNFEDAVYTTIYNGRNDSRLSSSVTMLVKTLPVLVHTEGSIAVSEMIKAVQDQLIGSMSNDIYSFAEISAAYGIRSDILFAYQGSEFVFDTFCNEKAEIVHLTQTTAKSPITITVFLKDGRYELNAEYQCERYNAAFIESFLEVFDRVLAEFARKERVEEVDILSSEAASRMEMINDTGLDFENISAARLFEKWVKVNPDKIAVISAGEKLTYKELNDKANVLAARLIKMGVAKDSIVGLLLKRSVNIPVCELAILKAGGAFLPILPEYPDDRIGFCLADSESKVVITTDEIKNDKQGLFNDEKKYSVLTLEDIENDEPADNPVDTPDTDALAYCIYTSGSTGVPKGVMIENHNLANFVQTFSVAKDMFNSENGGETGIALGSVSFDIHIIEILLPLCNGKTVVIATEEEVHNPVSFTDLMLRNNVDVMACTPSFIMNMLGIEYFEKALSGIKSIMVGAEIFPSGLYEKLVSVSPNIYIVNAYGPTECTVSASAKHITNAEGITIGGPAPNYKLYIIDKFGRKMPLYATGELLICGEGVGRGYINLPEKNAEVFTEIDGIRGYRSGDVARFNSDGELEFSGRMDNQVKLRGYRVELDEIEKTICDFANVKICKVVVRNNGSEDYLVAFFTANTEVNIEDLTAYLKSKLTYYMVPDVIKQLDAMPLTPNGKIDKKALPNVERTKKEKSRKAPKKSLEQELCDLFGNVLGFDEFYADDNFFEEGGTSLSASKIIMQLQSRGMTVEYQDIFDNPTPEMLAEVIERSRRVASNTVTDSGTDDIVSDYPEQLKYNTLEYAGEVKREPLGNVLLTGAVGFLGIHILDELIRRKEGKIICLIRRGSFASATSRLKSMLMYYFGELYEDAIREQIVVVDADITDDVIDLLADYEINTIINCAAIVKHYAADDILERVNVGGVENMIKVAKAKNARLVQISTISIPGAHTEETYRRSLKGYENKLFVVDDMGNKYSISKYHAELKVLEAIKNGMRGKIVRVGNLMGRQKDGEFQINLETNAFLNAVRGFATIGKSPISHATDPMSFSPVDMTAKAVVLLAGTNDKFTAFNADSRFRFDEWQLIEAANKCGVKITPVPDAEYYADYHKMLGDAKINAKLQGLMTNDRPDIHGVESDNKFTTNILYRLGFSWVLPDSSYLERVLNGLLSLDYFGDDTL